MELEAEGNLESLLRWAAGYGISDSVEKASPHSCLGRSLCVCFFPDAGGRGLGAVRQLNKGELVLKVPKSGLLTTQSLSLEDEKLAMALERYPSLSSAQEAVRGGTHTSSTCPTVMTYWQLLENLKSKPCRWIMPSGQQKKLLQNLIRSGKELKDLWKSRILKSNFKSSRHGFGPLQLALYVPWDEAGCLCPVGDLFNYAAPEGESLDIRDVSSLSGNMTTDDELHEEQQDTQRALTDGGFEETVSAYCFYARESYKKGQQVLLSYGTYTNLELLEYYGFVLWENPNDKVYIPLEHDIYTTSSWPKESLYIHQNGNPSFALLSALRLWATRPNKRRAIGHLAYSGAQLSTENEIFVMQLLSKNCHTVLNNLPTSIKDDNQLLCNISKLQDPQIPREIGKILSTYGGELFSFLETNGLMNGDEAELHLSGKTKHSLDRWKLAVQWRLLYKKALVDCISYCTRTIGSLSSQSGASL